MLLQAALAWPLRDAAAVASSGVALLPGSDAVYEVGGDHSAEDCAHSACPNEAPASVPPGSPPPGINHAPLMSGGAVGAVSAASPAAFRAAAWQLLAFLGSLEVQLELFLDPESGESRPGLSDVCTRQAHHVKRVLYAPRASRVRLQALCVRHRCPRQQRVASCVASCLLLGR